MNHSTTSSGHSSPRSPLPLPKEDENEDSTLALQEQHPELLFKLNQDDKKQRPRKKYVNELTEKRLGKIGKGWQFAFRQPRPQLAPRTVQRDLAFLHLL